MNKLLQKAKSIKKKKPRYCSKEEAEVLVEFFNGNLTYAQTSKVIEGMITPNGNSVNYGKVATLLKQAIRSGFVEVKYNK
jgi:hypothetical protein